MPDFLVLRCIYFAFPLNSSSRILIRYGMIWCAIRGNSWMRTSSLAVILARWWLHLSVILLNVLLCAIDCPCNDCSFAWCSFLLLLLLSVFFSVFFFFLQLYWDVLTVRVLLIYPASSSQCFLNPSHYVIRKFGKVSRQNFFLGLQYCLIRLFYYII